MPEQPFNQNPPNIQWGGKPKFLFEGPSYTLLSVLMTSQMKALGVMLITSKGETPMGRSPPLTTNCCFSGSSWKTAHVLKWQGPYKYLKSLSGLIHVASEKGKWLGHRGQVWACGKEGEIKPGPFRLPYRSWRVLSPIYSSDLSLFSNCPQTDCEKLACIPCLMLSVDFFSK